MKNKNMENFENLQNKYTPEDIKFFNALAEEYGLEQNEEHLIIIKNDGSRVFLPKWYEIPTKTGKIGIEDLIKKNMEDEN